MTGPYWISDTDISFPPVELALTYPNGLLAVGGDLSPERIINAYRHGIFPWFSDDQPILWWSPNPRAILFPKQLAVSRSLRKSLKKKRFLITINTHFEAVMHECAQPREDGLGTWITPEMHAAYVNLHNMGIAHSIEAWQGSRLVGGLYGLGIGKVFFGESMFSRVTDASKTAFVYLVKQLEKWGYSFIDCQVSSAHLSSLGAIDVPREEFIQLLEDNIDLDGQTEWSFDDDFDPLASI